MPNPSPAFVETEQALRAAPDARDVERTRQYLRLALTRRKEHLATSEEAIAALLEFAGKSTTLPLVDKLNITEDVTETIQHIAQAMRALTDAIANLEGDRR